MGFEVPGAFYLGKEYDVSEGSRLDQLLMYDARDLTTHAVCIGMTGSGKTGLCIDLLEEAAIDEIPALIIDPKGDMTNLLLSFPELRAQDFRPWVNADDARRNGLTVDAFAAQQAEVWRSGLAEWGQDGDRIRMMREAADFVIYTPGSDAGVPVSILQSFAAPSLSWDTDTELLRERIQGAVSALLALVGLDADPVQSREHILLSSLFEHFWRQGEDLDLPKLILSIQKPPLRKLGVFDVDTFFPEGDRFKLAMRINNIIAAPAFRSWLQGQAMDISGFLSTPDGKPRHSVFYIAHLSEPERMFFVTMLLNQIITWMRTQPGTTSLRALLYMDEIFGFFPPVANPPSKRPMLTLLKQARAFGVGVVLTTQNPVDLDYKGLTNAGTWFIGRLQTERDKRRLLDGLESVSSQAGEALDRSQLSATISALEKRVFLLHNVHEREPVTFQTRWAMSYLRGPMTRLQVRELMEDRPPDRPAESPLDRTAIGHPGDAQTGPAVEAAGDLEGMAPSGREISDTPPSLSARVQQVYLPVRRGASTAAVDMEASVGQAIEIQSSHLVYRPAVLGMGRLHFVDRTRDVNEQEEFALLVKVPERLGIVSWEQARSVNVGMGDLRDTPDDNAHFEQLPESLNESPEFTALKNNLNDYLYHNSTLVLQHSPALDVYEKPDETDQAFRMRLLQLAREKRDERIDEITERYEKDLNRVRDRLRRVQADVARREADVTARKQATLVSMGESVIGMFLGRRSMRMASTALSKQRQAGKAKLQLEEAQDEVKELEKDMASLEEELRERVAAVKQDWEEAVDDLESYEVRPRRKDVRISFFGLAWFPHWRIAYQVSGGETDTDFVEAFL